MLKANKLHSKNHPNPALFHNSVGFKQTPMLETTDLEDYNALVFQNGYKGFNFIVFNPLNYEISTTDELIFNEIQLQETEFWKRIKSKTWSCNCNFFFVVNKKNIILGNTKDNQAFLCNKTIKILEHFLIAASSPKNKNQ